MGPNTLAIKATSENTAGRFFLSETTVSPGFPGPPPHVHDELHDMFYVLEGKLTVLLGETEHELGPGSFACVEPGDVHTFRNASEAPVRFLNFNVPGGFELYMRELAAASASGTPPTTEEIGKIASRYDFRAV
jgi:quercetin dioxygenase-like cupin family protein